MLISSGLTLVTTLRQLKLSQFLSDSASLLILELCTYGNPVQISGSLCLERLGPASTVLPAQQAVCAALFWIPKVASLTCYLCSKGCPCPQAVIWMAPSHHSGLICLFLREAWSDLPYDGHCTPPSHTLSHGPTGICTLSLSGTYIPRGQGPACPAHCCILNWNLDWVEEWNTWLNLMGSPHWWGGAFLPATIAKPLDSVQSLRHRRDSVMTYWKMKRNDISVKYL